MKTNLLALIVLGALLIAIALQVSYYYATLPAVVSATFDAAGRGHGHTPKGQFMLFYLAIVFMICTTPVFAFLPDAGISVPHRDYWLSAERRVQTRRWLVSYLLWFTDATLLLMAALMQATFHANFSQRPSVGLTPWLLLGLYLLFVAALTIGLARRFYRVPPAARGS